MDLAPADLAPADLAAADLAAADLAAEWRDRLRADADGYARLALDNIGREFPALVSALMTAPGQFPGRPRDRTPVFYGSFDWHSCVEMHWVLVRLLKTFASAPVPGAGTPAVPAASTPAVPEAGTPAVPAGTPPVSAAEIRAALDAQFTPEGMRAEAGYAAMSGTGLRHYGWGWALTLSHELTTWPDDKDAVRWASAMDPLAETLTQNFLGWLPKATYPIRSGLHANTSFALSRSLPHARLLADNGRPDLRDAIEDAARRWYAADAGYPGAWEPSGSDFLSPALTEAELMARLLTPDEFSAWLAAFLPGLAAGEPAALFTPAVVSDPSDGQIAHLHGLNLSRAWCFRRLAETLPPDDPRVPVCAAAARIHADASLPHTLSAPYTLTHWLAAYAVLLIS